MSAEIAALSLQQNLKGSDKEEADDIEITNQKQKKKVGICL